MHDCNIVGGQNENVSENASGRNLPEIRFHV